MDVQVGNFYYFYRVFFIKEDLELDRRMLDSLG
jgi:hypothetical protein